MVPDEKGAPSKKKQRKMTSSGLPFELSAEGNGIELFKRFRRFNLTRTHRFREDPRYGELLGAMRDTANSQAVCDELLDALQPLSDAELSDPDVRFSKVGVVSNLEADAINAAQAYAFARHHGMVLVRWRLKLVGQDAQRLNGALLDEFYEEEPGLWGYFVKGAPGMINDNLAQRKGIVNGTSCVMHSLTLDKDAHDDLEQLMRRAGPGGVVTLSQPPRSINVQPQVIPKFADRLRPHSLVDSSVVIPIKLSPEQESFTPTSLVAAMNGALRPRASTKNALFHTRAPTTQRALACPFWRPPKMPLLTPPLPPLGAHAARHRRQAQAHGEGQEDWRPEADQEADLRSVSQGPRRHSGVCRHRLQAARQESG
mgnify:CR=1 FL=1